MKLFSIIAILLFLLNSTFAQVDMRKYTSGDLFKSEPIITKDFLKEDNDIQASEQEFMDEIQIGLDYWNAFLLDDAIDHFSNMAESYPEIQILHYYLGGILFDRKKYDEAIESLTQSLVLDPLFLDAKYMIGVVQIAQNKRKEAETTFESLLTIPLYASYGYYGLGILSSSKNNYLKAKKMFEKCLETDPEFRDAYLPLTKIELSLSKRKALKTALPRMNKALELDSTWQQARLIRAVLSIYKDNNIDIFEKDINTLIRQNPENYHYHSIRGYLNIELHKYREAVNNFQNAYNLSMDTLNRGGDKVRRGRYDFRTKMKTNKPLQSAINYYQQKLHKVDEKSKKLIDKGICSFINFNLYGALAYFDSAYKNEESAVVDFFKGVYYETVYYDYEKAINFYNLALWKDPLNFRALYNRGNLYYQEKRYDLAYDDFSQVIKLRPKDKNGFKVRAALHLKLENYLRAYADYSVAVSIDPTDGNLFFERGTAAFKAKYYDNSIMDFNKHLESRPKNAMAYFMISKNNLQKKDTINAIFYLDSASSLSKHISPYHSKLLELATSKNDTEKMKNAHDRLIKYNRWNNIYRFERGKFFYHQDEYDKAIKDFKILLKEVSNYPELYFYLGKTELKLGNEKVGIRYIEKAKKLGYKE